MAKLYAKMGYSDRSLEYLRKVLEEGYKDFKELDKDAEFAGLRKDKRFTELMAAKPRSAAGIIWAAHRKQRGKAIGGKSIQAPWQRSCDEFILPTERGFCFANAKTQNPQSKDLYLNPKSQQARLGTIRESNFANQSFTKVYKIRRST